MHLTYNSVYILMKVSKFSTVKQLNASALLQMPDGVHTSLWERFASLSDSVQDKDIHWKFQMSLSL